MKEEEIASLILNLLKTAHIKHIKADLFQDLYLYYLQLEKRYKPELNVPEEAFLIKFLTWRMWKLIKNHQKTSGESNLIENAPDYREEDEEVDLSPLIEGLSCISEPDMILLILRHIQNKSYLELAQQSGLSIEGVRKKLNKIEGRIKWEGTNKEMKKKEE